MAEETTGNTQEKSHTLATLLIHSIWYDFRGVFLKMGTHQVHINVSPNSGSRENGKDLDSGDNTCQYAQTSPQIYRASSLK